MNCHLVRFVSFTTTDPLPIYIVTTARNFSNYINMLQTVTTDQGGFAIRRRKFWYINQSEAEVDVVSSVLKNSVSHYIGINDHGDSKLHIPNRSLFTLYMYLAIIRMLLEFL